MVIHGDALQEGASFLRKTLAAFLHNWAWGPYPILVLDGTEASSPGLVRCADELGIRVTMSYRDTSQGWHSWTRRNIDLVQTGDCFLIFWDGVREDVGHLITLIQNFDKPLRVMLVGQD